MKHLLTILVTTLTVMSCNQTTPTVATLPGEPVLDTAMTPEQKAARRFTPEVMWKMGRISSTTLSPNGSHLLYALTYYSMPENRGVSSLWVMPTPTGAQAATTTIPIQITDNAARDHSPQWSADGSAIYFISNRSGSDQIWRVDATGENLIQMSALDESVGGFGVAPSGDKIWIVKEVKVDKVDSGERFAELPKSKARIYDDLMVRHFDTWEDGSYNHIFVGDFSAQGSFSAGTPGYIGPLVDIMPGEAWDAPTVPYFDMTEIGWNNGGTALAYTCKKLTGYAYSMSTDSDIYLYTMADGSTRNLTEGMPGYDKYPRFSPDDSRLAWQSMERPCNESDKDRIFVMDLATGSKRYLTPNFDYNASNLCWSASGEDIYFIAPIEATHQICCVSTTAPDPKVKVLTSGLHDYTSLSLAYARPASAGPTECVAPAAMQPVMVAEKTTISMATEIFGIDPALGSDYRITDINAPIYSNVDMGEVQKRWVKTSDGKQMLVWVILPPDFDPAKKYPTLLYCQGGPQSVVSQRWSYRWNYQLMAAQGYIIVAPNRRGLPSFGQEWLDQISGDYSGQNIRDYLSAIDDVARESWVDRDRLGAVGASYGGYSVFYLAGHHNKRFKALIAHCGMFNLESFYGETEELWFPYNDLGGPYWDRATNPVANRSYSNSPHLFVNNWDAPILIFTGEKDFRIPYTQSLQAFTAARAHGVASRLVVFEDEGHQVFKPQNSLVWNNEFFDWLNKYLKK